MTHRFSLSPFSRLVLALTLGALTLAGCGSGSKVCLNIARVSVVEGDSGSTAAVLTVTLSETSESTVVASYTTTDGTATAGSDYTPDSGTITFAPGDTSQSLTIQVNGDTTFEEDETFSVDFTITSGEGDSSTVSVPVTIVNDDLPQVSIATSAPNGEVAEAAGTAEFVVSLVAEDPIEADVTVQYGTSDGTATAPGDYTAIAGGSVVFPAGSTSTSQPVDVVVQDDAEVEPDETFTVALTGVSANAEIDAAADSATATIVDDDFPELTIADVSVSEGDGSATFTVIAAPAPAKPITVNIATGDAPVPAVQAAEAGTDYTVSSDTLTFDPDEESQSFTVPVVDDQAVEDDEVFLVTLSGPVNATLGTESATGTIVNDDFPTVSISDTPVRVLEGNGGARNAVFTVSLSEPYDFGAVSVDYATADGTNPAGDNATTADLDYTETSGTLTIAAGDTQGFIQVPVNGDGIVEPDETFTVNLSNPSNAVLGVVTADGVILNDEANGLADTAITLCADGITTPDDAVSCVPTGQDAEYGWDIVEPNPADGTAGFSYVKVAADGTVLADDAASWACVLDRRTGLLWEAKTNDGHLHDGDWTYTWYRPDPLPNLAPNGGDPGVESDGASCGGTLASCDTDKLVTAVNAEGLCGYTDWRLPSVEELRSLVDYSIPQPGDENPPVPAVDLDWFPNTPLPSGPDFFTLFWSYSSGGSYNALEADFTGEAWALSFTEGLEVLVPKADSHYVRLVRDGTLPAVLPPPALALLRSFGIDQELRARM